MSESTRLVGLSGRTLWEGRLPAKLPWALGFHTSSAWHWHVQESRKARKSKPMKSWCSVEVLGAPEAVSKTECAAFDMSFSGYNYEACVKHHASPKHHICKNTEPAAHLGGQAGLGRPSACSRSSLHGSPSNASEVSPEGTRRETPPRSPRGFWENQKKLLGAPGIATRSKHATRGSWPYY